MSMKSLSALLAFSVFALSPALPILEASDQGAAFANNGNGNGNGNGGGNGNGKANGNGAGKSAEKKSADPANGNAAAKKAKPAASEMGKMNGALNANIKAVLAHIRNGQVTKGPVGLLAGLAVADVAAATAAAELADLQASDAAFSELDTALSEAGFDTVEDYLQAKLDGTLTDEQLAAVESLDSLIEGVGGVSEDGTTLAEAPPTEDEILAAEEAAADAALGVAGAETAIGDAWNKDGDLAALLVLLRDKLAPYQDDIAAILP